METIKEKKKAKTDENIASIEDAMLEEKDELLAEIEDSDAAVADEAQLFPLLPWLLKSSGLYKWSSPHYRLPYMPVPNADNVDASNEFEAQLLWGIKEELRVDVDGRYPQNTISGTIKKGLGLRLDWIASVKRVKRNNYVGKIWYKNGAAALLPYTHIKVRLYKSIHSAQRKVRIRFYAAGVSSKTITYRFSSKYFHNVNFEFDCAKGTTPVTAIHTHDHPNYPASLPAEKLSITKIYQRAGFRVSKSGANIVPLAGANADAKWSDQEMHDAMQLYWSKFANVSQWAMWTFFAGLHEMGTSLGGIMFDDIGPNHRQGVALFNKSFINTAPAGDPDPAAYIKRMKLWTAVHEMGHGFNLAHSWQKALGTPWIPLANDPEARSFMNYPYNVIGGQAAFFANFDFRFTNSELLFLRHAPDHFVQPGNADWFDHHGFEQANVLPQSTFNLDLRIHRRSNLFEFMEPVNIELKLTNNLQKPQLINEDMLSHGDRMAVIIKKRDKAARQWHSYSTALHEPNVISLAPGQSVYESLSVNSGLNGWDIAEPGVYTLQVMITLENEDIVSNPLEIRVAPPQSYDAELIAQDYFSDGVGRVLAFDGSMFFEKENDVLREVEAKLSKSRAAAHAKLALTTPLSRGYKYLKIPDVHVERISAVHEANGEITVNKAKVDKARDGLMKVLVSNPEEAAETFGHIQYRNKIEKLSEFIYKDGDPANAEKCMRTGLKTLKSRGVLTSVVKEMENQAKDLNGLKSAKRPANANN